MHTLIISTRFTFSGSKKTGQRICGTHQKIFAENILGQGRGPMEESQKSSNCQSRILDERPDFTSNSSVLRFRTSINSVRATPLRIFVAGFVKIRAFVMKLFRSLTTSATKKRPFSSMENH